MGDSRGPARCFRMDKLMEHGVAHVRIPELDSLLLRWNRHTLAWIFPFLSMVMDKRHYTCIRCVNG